MMLYYMYLYYCTMQVLRDSEGAAAVPGPGHALAHGADDRPRLDRGRRHWLLLGLQRYIHHRGVGHTTPPAGTVRV